MLYMGLMLILQMPGAALPLGFGIEWLLDREMRGAQILLLNQIQHPQLL